MNENGLEEIKDGLINNQYIIDINLGCNFNKLSIERFKILNEILMKNNKIEKNKFKW